MNERIHLLLPPHLMKQFREMARNGYRSVSSQLALLVEQEVVRQLQASSASEAMAGSRGRNSEKDSHRPSP